MMKVNDYILVQDELFRVVGVFLGAVGELNLVSIEPINKKAGSVLGGIIPTMHVPEKLLLQSAVVSTLVVIGGKS